MWINRQKAIDLVAKLVVSGKYRNPIEAMNDFGVKQYYDERHTFTVAQTNCFVKQVQDKVKYPNGVSEEYSKLTPRQKDMLEDLERNGNMTLTTRNMRTVGILQMSGYVSVDREKHSVSITQEGRDILPTLQPC
jgi:hypothetical protein